MGIEHTCEIKASGLLCTLPSSSLAWCSASEATCSINACDCNILLGCYGMLEVQNV